MDSSSSHLGPGGTPPPPGPSSPPTPYAHQEREHAHALSPARHMFWEMGTGKSFTAIRAAAAQRAAGLIDAMLVVAPNGVHENWATDELPKHLADVPHLVTVYRSQRASTKWHQEALKRAIETPLFSVVCVSYDAFMTLPGKKFCRKFLDKREVLFVADESQRIKSPGAKRTMSLLAAAKYAVTRRILSGTPVTKSPLDVYSQMRFLDPDVWHPLGIDRFESFQARYGIEKEFKREIRDDAGNVIRTERFSKIVAFQKIEEIKAVVDAYGERVTKEEALDLPPKVYTKRHFELSPEQRRVYDALRAKFMAELPGGALVTAPRVITLLLRLQQVTCGYVPDDMDTETLHFLGDNPRVRLLLDTLADVEGKAIIWARFRQDINQICAELGPAAVRYDGSTSDADRLTARRRFQDPDDPARFFVANPAAAATGLTLTEARTVIYYSNSFDLEHRQQSEDRAHRIGQRNAVTYVDLVASGTVDAHIVQSLRAKRSLAAQVTGDELKKWI